MSTERLTELRHQAKALLTESLHQLWTWLTELFSLAKALLAKLFDYLSTLLAELFHDPSTLRERMTELWQEGYSHYLGWYQGADILTQYTVLALTAGTLFLIWVIVYLSRFTK